MGLEPTTVALQVRRSDPLSYQGISTLSGNRTHDTLLRRQVLYPLSYQGMARKRLPGGFIPLDAVPRRGRTLAADRGTNPDQRRTGDVRPLPFRRVKYMHHQSGPGFRGD